MVLSRLACNGCYGSYRLYVWYVSNRAYTEHGDGHSELDINIIMDNNMTDEQLDALDALLIKEWLKNNEVTECEPFERTCPEQMVWKRTKGTKKQQQKS